MVMGLTTGIWVAAQVRICDRNFIPATIVRRGVSDAGTVLLKLNRFERRIFAGRLIEVAVDAHIAERASNRRERWFGDFGSGLGRRRFGHKTLFLLQYRESRDRKRAEDPSAGSR